MDLHPLPGDERIVTPDGIARPLNLRPSIRSRLAAVPVSGLVLPDSEIRDFDAWPRDLSIKDQGAVGACNGHATATALEYARRQSGQPHLPLSAWYVYGRLVMGRDTGSNILEALDLITSEGCAPELLVKYGDFSGRYTAEVMDAARRFRLEIGARLTNWQEVLARVALREPINLSICVGARFNQLDSEGVPTPARGPANHAVMVGGGIKTSPKWGRLVLCANSWGVGWGRKGYCWLAEAHIAQASWFEAFTIRAATEDPSDKSDPPKVLA